MAIRPRIDDKNAEPRLYFNKENTAIISTNESITNLVDILSIKDVTVYAIEFDYFNENIYAYKINSNERYLIW